MKLSSCSYCLSPWGCAIFSLVFILVMTIRGFPITFSILIFSFLIKLFAFCNNYVTANITTSTTAIPKTTTADTTISATTSNTVRILTFKTKTNALCLYNSQMSKILNTNSCSPDSCSPESCLPDSCSPGHLLTKQMKKWTLAHQ